MEGRETTQEDVENHSQTPAVHLETVSTANQYLWRDVPRSAAGCRHQLIVIEASQAEIADLENPRRAIFGVQQILWFQIPVDYPHLVAVSDGLDDWLEHTRCLLLAVELFLHNPLKQLASLHDLHYCVQIVGLVKDLMCPHHVDVVYLGHDLDLELQVVDFVRAQFGLVDRLDGILLAGALVNGLVDLAKSAISECFLQDIVACKTLLGSCDLSVHDLLAVYFRYVKKAVISLECVYLKLSIEMRLAALIDELSRII